MKLIVEKKIIIQELISEGKTDEVFKHIDLKDKNILLVKSRYNSGKNQYHLGIIDNAEWQKIQNQINNAILDFIQQDETDDASNIIIEKNKKDKNRSLVMNSRTTEKEIAISIKTRLYLLAIKSSEVFGYATMCIGLFLIYISITWLLNTDESKQLTLLLPSGIGSPDVDKPIFSPELFLFFFGLIIIVSGFVCTLISQLFKVKNNE